ncbi:MAG: PIN domain-containing protein [Blastocatellia bacterium]
MNAVDTNILVYAHDPRDPAKRTAAMALLDSLIDGVLLWQVACEFLWVSRKLEPHGYTQAQAGSEIKRLRRVWATLIPDWQVQDRAEILRTKYSLSFWDALIVAACLEGSVARLYSEDFDAYSQIESLALINPFKTL